MKEIYAYANPLTMDKDATIWSLIKKYPQFCASDTLMQGMIRFYGREKFGIIQTVNDLQKSLVGEIVNNVHFDMQFFLDVSHEIRQSTADEKIQKSFRANINEIVNSIRYLLFLEADYQKLIGIDSASQEQLELFRIYEKINRRYCSKMNEIINKPKSAVEKEIKRTVLSEAEYLIKQAIRGKDIPEIKDYHCNSASDAKEKLKIIENNIKEVISQRQDNDYSNTEKTKNKIFRIEYAQKMIDRLYGESLDTIIIHGVHKFTPEILLMNTILEKCGINIIYLIHYVDNLPQVYGTWREVYSWMKTDFKNVKPFDISVGSPTGREIAKVLAGGLSTEEINSHKMEYENISEFAVDEVRNTFIEASEELFKMKTQYYAVSNLDTNEILKNYFPDQFEVKPFLSYPIGQFILGMYNMRDFDNSCMKLNSTSLKECVSSGVFENEVGKNISEIFEDIMPYIEDLENLNDVYKRLTNLVSERKNIDKKNILNDLRAICYYSRNDEEINQFIKYLKLLEELSNKVFGEKKEQIDFNKHFKNLMEVLTEPFKNAFLAHKAEVLLAQEILETLNVQKTNSVMGDYMDVKDALTFFLHQTKGDDSSNWIVRNFEQLDGAVLLANHTNAREYHFALLSMKNMSKNDSEELPWPLNEELFYEYDADLESAMHASAISNKERPNFLKYSLFFGTFFFKKKVTFSYIKNLNGERQRAFYLFDLLHMKEALKDENADVHFGDKHNMTQKKSFDFETLTIEQREMFAICKYKFFLNRVLNEPIVYHDDYQIKYFIINFIIRTIIENARLTSVNKDEYIKKYIERFALIFPNYDVVIFRDIERRVKNAVEQSMGYTNSKEKNEQFNRRKKNFLLNKWDNTMNFDNVSEQEVVDYMVNDDILLAVENRPHEKICENCNFYAECLMKYYDGIQERDKEVK